MTDRDRLINELKKAKNRCLIHESGGCLACKYRGQADCTLENLADHLLANDVIVPPCKVGDVVYAICTIFDESTLKPKTIIKPRIIDFASKVGFIIESKGLVIGEKEFGKTVFLTKEEAEAKLKELGKIDT